MRNNKPAFLPAPTSARLPTSILHLSSFTPTTHRHPSPPSVAARPHVSRHAKTYSSAPTTVPTCQHNNNNNNKNNNNKHPEGFEDPTTVDPSTDSSYAEVVAHSFSTPRHRTAVITLRPLPPVNPPPTANQDTRVFRLSVTRPQIDSLRRALSTSPPPSSLSTTNKKKNNVIINNNTTSNTSRPQWMASGMNPSANQHKRHANTSPFALPEDRPSTHDLLKTIITTCGAVVRHAAITHMHSDIFIARIWLRTPYPITDSSLFFEQQQQQQQQQQNQQHHLHSPSTSQDASLCSDKSQSDEDATEQSNNDAHYLTSIDARPSDALILAIQHSAPLYLNRTLLDSCGTPLSSITDEINSGLCSVIQYPDHCKSAHSLLVEARRHPTHKRLAVLKARLDLAVRLQRFHEAAEMHDEIGRLCPLDKLQDALAQAVDEERFLDAAKLQDEITLWRARLRMWEKGTLDLEDYSFGGDDTPNSASS